MLTPRSIRRNFQEATSAFPRRYLRTAPHCIVSQVLHIYCRLSEDSVSEENYIIASFSSAQAGESEDLGVSARMIYLHTTVSYVAPFDV